MKGFGETSSSQRPQRKKKSEESESSTNEDYNVVTTISRQEQQSPSTTLSSIQSVLSAVKEDSQTSKGLQQVEEPLNTGQVALAKLRRERAEQKDAELRKVREMMQMEEQSKQSAPAIPEKVAMRMGQRMLPFVGIPFFLAMGTFVGFWYMATYRDMEFQPALVAISTTILLAFGLLGITYSVMSASWDSDREGSFVGFDEFQKNIKNIQSGFSRTRENTLLKEKMANLSPEEIKMALDDLDQREKKQQDFKKKQSLEAKLQDELE